MNYYESIFILHPDLSSEQSEALQKTMAGIVAKQGGEIHVVEDWGVKRLAYEVRKQQKGRYVLMQFAAEGPAVRELERNYRVNDSVIKYMTLRIDRNRLKPVVPAQTETPADAAPAGAETAERGE